MDIGFIDSGRRNYLSFSCHELYGEKILSQDHKVGINLAGRQRVHTHEKYSKDTFPENNSETFAENIATHERATVSITFPYIFVPECDL